jgi:hypothetical protein
MTCTEPSRILRITRGEITRVIRIAQGLGKAGADGADGTSVFVSPTPPPSPADGAGWFDTTTGQLSTWVASQGVWVAATPYSTYTPPDFSAYPPGSYVLSDGTYLASNDGTEYFQQPPMP